MLIRSSYVFLLVLLVSVKSKNVFSVPSEGSRGSYYNVDLQDLEPNQVTQQGNPDQPSTSHNSQLTRENLSLLSRASPCARSAPSQAERRDNDALSGAAVSDARVTASSTRVPENRLELQKFKYNVIAAAYKELADGFKVKHTFDIRLEHKTGKDARSQAYRLSDDGITKCMQEAKRNLYKVGIKDWQMKLAIANTLDQRLREVLPGALQLHRGCLEEYAKDIRELAGNDRQDWNERLEHFLEVAAEYRLWKAAFNASTVTSGANKLDLEELFQRAGQLKCDTGFYYKDQPESISSGNSRTIFRRCKEIVQLIKTKSVASGIGLAPQESISKELMNIARDHKALWEQEQNHLNTNISPVRPRLEDADIPVTGFNKASHDAFCEILEQLRLQAEQSEQASMQSEQQRAAERVAREEAERALEAERVAREEAVTRLERSEHYKAQADQERYLKIITLYAKCSALEHFYRHNGMEGFFDDKLGVISCYQIINHASESIETKLRLLNLVSAQLQEKERILLKEKPVHIWVFMKHEEVALRELRDLVQNLQDTACIEKEAFIQSLMEIHEQKQCDVSAAQGSYLDIFPQQVCLIARHGLTEYCIDQELASWARDCRAGEETIRLDVTHDGVIKPLGERHSWFDYLRPGYLDRAELERALLGMKKWDEMLKRPMNYKPLLTDVDEIWNRTFNAARLNNPLFVGTHCADNSLEGAYQPSEFMINEFLRAVDAKTDQYRNNLKEFLTTDLKFPESGLNHWEYPNPHKYSVNADNIIMTASSIKRMLATVAQVFALEQMFKVKYRDQASRNTTAYHQYGGMDVLLSLKKLLCESSAQEGEGSVGPLTMDCSGIFEGASSDIQRILSTFEKHDTFEEIKRAMIAVLQSKPLEERRDVLRMFFKNERDMLNTAKRSLEASKRSRSEEPVPADQDEQNMRNIVDMFHDDVIEFVRLRIEVLRNGVLGSEASLGSEAYRSMALNTGNWTRLPDALDVPIDPQERAHALAYYGAQYAQQQRLKMISSERPVEVTHANISAPSSASQESYRTPHTAHKPSSFDSKPKGWSLGTKCLIAGGCILVVVGVAYCIAPAAVAAAPGYALEAMFRVAGWIGRGYLRSRGLPVPI